MYAYQGFTFGGILFEKILRIVSKIATLKFIYEP